MEFIPFPKIARLMRECVITEKIDGTNACVQISGDTIVAQSRTRVVTPDNDNFGFASWVKKHHDELLALGEGVHFGEWWGVDIQRKYGLDHKRFSLFNVGRWTSENPPPACCHIVPILAKGTFDSIMIHNALAFLAAYGSHAAPGFMNPEGIIIYHTAARTYFKKTFKNDDKGKEFGA